MSRIQIRKGDVINVSVYADGKGKKEIHTYKVAVIPKHGRFIVCTKILNDKETSIRECFTSLFLSKNLVWGGTKA